MVGMAVGVTDDQVVALARVLGKPQLDDFVHGLTQGVVDRLLARPGIEEDDPLIAEQQVQEGRLGAERLALAQHIRMRVVAMHLEGRIGTACPTRRSMYPADIQVPAHRCARGEVEVTRRCGQTVSTCGGGTTSTSDSAVARRRSFARCSVSDPGDFPRPRQRAPEQRDQHEDQRARKSRALRVAQQSGCEDQLRRVAGRRDEREGEVDPALGKARHEIARSARSWHEVARRKETDPSHDEARRCEEPDTSQRTRQGDEENVDEREERCPRQHGSPLPSSGFGVVVIDDRERNEEKACESRRCRRASGEEVRVLAKHLRTESTPRSR